MTPLNRLEINALVKEQGCIARSDCSFATGIFSLVLSGALVSTPAWTAALVPLLSAIWGFVYYRIWKKQAKLWAESATSLRETDKAVEDSREARDKAFHELMHTHSETIKLMLSAPERARH